jgi:hypothetical protein
LWNCLSIRCVGSFGASPDGCEKAGQAGANGDLSGYARNNFLDLAADPADLRGRSETKRRIAIDLS